ncbi:hypothetical protein HPB47_018617 [Ixodes persulcatus]|uniref:Uncharacterized protein n=1 Tax=Ixodes persulcatus TaxID=34615 RepID=A0AC60QMT8_IXOPE|nr:hypothetical protein HPB47_018617 [Ixodes persulcatus]
MWKIPDAYWGTCESRCLVSGVTTDPEPCGFARPRLAVRDLPVSGEEGILVVEPSRGRFGPFGAPRAPLRPQNNLQESRVPQVTLGAHSYPSRFRHDLRLTGSLVPVVLLKMGSEAVVPLPRRRPALLPSNRAHLRLPQLQKMLKA